MIRAALPLVLLLAASLASAFELTGVVQDKDSAPIPGASVWLSQERHAVKTVTDENGAFAFPDIHTGMVHLVARKEEFALGGLTKEALGPDRVELTLPPADSITMLLIDHSARPVTGARVKRLIVNDSFEVFVDDLTPLGFPSIRSDAEGNLTIDAVPAGGFLAIELAHRSYCPLHISHVPVGLKETTTYQLFPGQLLSGRATDIKGQPVAGARVFVAPAEGEIQLTFADVLTDKDGYFSTRLVPGLYDITAIHPDYPSPPPSQVQMSDATNDTSLRLSFPENHLIEGSVVGPDGQPMPGVLVSYLADGTIRDETLTDIHGTYHLKALKKGQVHVTPPDSFMNAQALDVRVEFKRKDKIRQSPLHLVALPKLTGTVSGPGGASVPGALLSLSGMQDPLWAAADESGRFEIQLPALPEIPSPTLRVEHPLRLLRKEVPINIRKVAPLDIRLESYDPNLEPNRPELSPNDLSSLVDEKAPELACSSWINSAPLKLADLQGKVVVLTFWNGFDPFSRTQIFIPELLRLYHVFKDTDDVAFIMVHDGAEDLETIESYLKDYAIEFPVGVDESPFVTFDLYDTNALPQTVLIDKKGILRYFDVRGRLLELIKDLRRKA